VSISPELEAQDEELAGSAQPEEDEKKKKKKKKKSSWGPKRSKHPRRAKTRP
jgi:hypothetical protein